MKILQHHTLYHDPIYDAAFPSVVTRPDGEILVAFQRSPDRRRFRGSWSQWDPNAQCVVIRSKDHGSSWSPQPELACAHPMGAARDPSLLQLRSGDLIMTSYLSTLIPSETWEASPQSYGRNPWRETFAGGFVMRSNNAGKTWQGPYTPPLTADSEQCAFPGIKNSKLLRTELVNAGKEIEVSHEGAMKTEGIKGLASSEKSYEENTRITIPRFNRGAPVEARDGRIYWAASKNTFFAHLQLLVSDDGGMNWEVASDIHTDGPHLAETSMVETRMGDLLCFARSCGHGDHGYCIRSKNGGQSWEPAEDTGIVGHPYHALRLKDDRILLVYGYRHKPYGIRARILDENATRFDTPELIIRRDGDNHDIGCPWATQCADGRVLVVYYFHKADGVHRIEGTTLDI